MNPDSKKHNTHKHPLAILQRGGVTKRILTEKQLRDMGGFLTNDNGVHPYGVLDIGNDAHGNKNVLIYKLVPDSNTYKYLKKEVCNNIIIGYDDPSKKDGVTILLSLSDKHAHKYLYIGADIKEIYIDQTVIEYHSPLNKQYDVSYPYIISKDFVYLLLPNIFINNTPEVKAMSTGKYGPYHIYFNIVAEEASNVPIGSFISRMKD